MPLEHEIFTWLEQHSSNLHLYETPGRKALLFAAGLSELQSAFAFEGATLVFCRNVVAQLWRHGLLPDGRDPLIAVLETAKTLVGSDNGKKRQKATTQEKKLTTTKELKKKTKTRKKKPMTSHGRIVRDLWSLRPDEGDKRLCSCALRVQDRTIAYHLRRGGVVETKCG